MLYRTTFTTPSIIKIGLHDATNSFTIVETYIPYPDNCYSHPQAIQPYGLFLARTDVMVDHTKIDFNSFHTISPNNEQKMINLICHSNYFLTGPEHEKNAIIHTSNAMQENTDRISVLGNQISLASSYQNAAYKLYSIDGRCMASGTVAKNCNIDISSYTKGIYLLHLQSANKGIKTIKIIK
ncbi:MAG: T9SS type A sorting domain-containing protein [Bacteroidetes bacterium]|nr:T9SS type A sorting domain-containing protein [Bacteroidota bacterium]